ncbi:MAG TPA: hypothetical protein PLQ36_00510 [Candidatus Gracilibacteria bacterium]|nr:hypothetical protein [Candidatus Gracilibacteria bacterium]
MNNQLSAAPAMENEHLQLNSENRELSLCVQTEDLEEQKKILGEYYENNYKHTHTTEMTDDDRKNAKVEWIEKVLNDYNFKIVNNKFNNILKVDEKVAELKKIISEHVEKTDKKNNDIVTVGTQKITFEQNQEFQRLYKENPKEAKKFLFKIIRGPAPTQYHIDVLDRLDLGSLLVMGATVMAATGAVLTMGKGSPEAALGPVLATIAGGNYLNNYMGLKNDIPDLDTKKGQNRMESLIKQYLGDLPPEGLTKAKKMAGMMFQDPQVKSENQLLLGRSYLNPRDAFFYHDQRIASRTNREFLNHIDWDKWSKYKKNWADHKNQFFANPLESFPQILTDHSDFLTKVPKGEDNFYLGLVRVLDLVEKMDLGDKKELNYFLALSNEVNRNLAPDAFELFTR